MWTPEEEEILVKAHTELGDQWDEISKLIERWDPVSCRLKWNNENFKKGVKVKKTWTLEETRILEKEHAKLGNQWDKISKLIERWDPVSCKTRWRKVKRRRMK